MHLLFCLDNNLILHQEVEEEEGEEVVMVEDQVDLKQTATTPRIAANITVMGVTLHPITVSLGSIQLIPLLESLLNATVVVVFIIGKIDVQMHLAPTIEETIRTSVKVRLNTMMSPYDYLMRSQILKKYHFLLSQRTAK